MEIAFLTIPFTRKGKESTEITIRSLAKVLSDKGYNVSIISRRVLDLKEFEKDGKVRIYRPFKSEILNYIFSVDKVQRIRGKNFDVVHNFSSAPVVGLKASFAKLSNKDLRVVHTLKSYARSTFFRFRFLKALSTVDKIVVPTKIFKKKLVSLGTKSNRIVVINSNIDLHKFRPRSKTILKRKYGFAGKKVVLYYGALWEDKGLQFLVRAMPKITRENPNVIFVIAPRHWIRKIDAPMINAALNLKNVELVKKVKNIADYVNLADVVVLPYQSINATEGNPSCMLESMACKTAVVTSRIPELKEIVDDEKDVLMSKPGDISGLAKQINRLLSDSNLYKKLVDSSYKKSKDFDVKKIAKEYLKIYSN